ncbi:bifunctional phosphopantothenoylcysteine decarboxylase/phosphopantothenate--cysteine ligase CoaBC [Limosilactobacillus caecicola]|uniref:bifunctional phosphopantothenoylcysteine decarboxylase/phosphopantothenate--cysteine ligase CoaBC n=1 Tax=Limosilactobacillus caecicola TaxID=2941332 RepID=UPI00203E4393|nr:bifunctional phosphopantothenoylcysteine decarboxylase/phosphopantothenate--cysteine ligase CoaBC [Limosilactobacillus caecicola]
MAKIVVHITGSVAAFKAVTVVRLLQKQHHQVRVVMTKAATQLVGPATLASLTHYPVLTDLWKPAAAGQIPHIGLADWADYSIVVPASADVIAKLALGIADDPVTTTLLATPTPIVIVPAMNTHMYHQAATQRNLAQLRQDGKIILDPVHGQLAEGYTGDGRMPEPATIANFLNDLMASETTLANKTVLVSLGGTVAPIDPVRFIGNRSSGKMGWAIAKAALQMGAHVIVVAGRISINLPAENDRLTIKRVQTTQEMYEALAKEFPKSDILVMAAAVADFQVSSYTDQKIKKHSADQTLDLHLKPAVDILKTLGAQKSHQIVVGFAAETQAVLQNAQQKLAAKHADMIVANDVSGQQTGFNVDDNQVTLLRKDQAPETWPLTSKTAIGQRLMNVISKMME